MKKLLIIDNYDSFTYNLVHYFEELGAEVIIAYNDKIEIAEIEHKLFDGIVISPGPSNPENAGISLEVIRHFQNIPILGVCLGHQAIGYAYGAKIIRAPMPLHGKIDKIRNYQNSIIFKDLPSRFKIARYHSLMIDRQTLSDELLVTAMTDDNVIMGVEHKSRPLFGIQFHPESVATQHGHKMLQNFLDIIGLPS